MPLLAFGLACVTPPHIDPPDDRPQESVAETGWPDSGETAVPGEPCAEGMAPVFTGDTVHFCIDIYEIVLDGEGGDLDHFADGADRGDATTRSLPDVEPSVGYSFDQAVTACANTPVLDADGAVVGVKHLSTSAEWEDAGDGVFGEGGTSYPYGSTLDTSACGTLAEDGSPQAAGLLATGSYPDCVSDFGVYDLIGNAWEWADPQVKLDIEAWMGANSGATWAEDEPVTMPSGATASLVIDIAGINAAPPSQDELGRLYADISDIDTPDSDQLAYKGYIRPRDYTEASAKTHLAVQAHREGDRWMLYALPEEDGAPLTDKRGAAWYSGAYTTHLHQENLGHFHDFNGTIGFRCASDPLP